MKKGLFFACDLGFVLQSLVTFAGLRFFEEVQDGDQTVSTLH